MPPGGRSSFSAKEDALLVQYLAKFAGTEGRKGNNIYKQLCDNTSGLWPWSKQHSWQSWRSRYTKDSAEFDIRIRNYQNQPDPQELIEQPTKKRKPTANSNPKAEKRPRTESITPNNIPPAISKRQPTQERVNVPTKNPNAARAKPVPAVKLGFVDPSRINHRQSVAENRGEGPSRLPATRPKAIPSKLPSQEERLPDLPPSSASSTEDGVSTPRCSPPGSNDYNGEIFRTDGAHEMELDPEADQDDDEDLDEDLEVNSMLTDPVVFDTEALNIGANPSSKSASPSGQPLPSTNNSRIPARRKSSDAAAADSGFFESSSASTSNTSDVKPRNVPKPKPVPKLVEGPFGTSRYKQPTRKGPGSDSESEPQKAVNKPWPPSRGTRKQSAPHVNVPAPSIPVGKNRQTAIHRSPETLQSSSPSRARVSRKGKERQTFSDVEDGPSSLGRKARRINGDADETQFARFPQLRSTPLSHRDAHVPRAHDDDPYDGSLFTEPDFVPLPNSPHTPYTAPIHPFDLPSSQPSPTPHRSGGLEQELVSSETANSVIRALNSFVAEVDERWKAIQSSRQNAKSGQESLEELEGGDAHLRARGSPVRAGVRKESRGILETAENDTGLSSASSTTPHRTQQRKRSLVSSSKPIQNSEEELSVTNASMHSLFSATDSLSASRQPRPSILKGKNQAMEETHIRQPSPENKTSSSHSRLVDLRTMARTQRQKSFPKHRSPPLSPASSSTGVVHLGSISTSSSVESPIKLSVSDESRLIEQTIRTLSEEYNFPPDYVRRIWKDSGDLEEAAAILGKLKDVETSLLGARRRSSSSISGNKAGRKAPPALRSSPLSSEKSRSGSSRIRNGKTTEVSHTVTSGGSPSKFRQSHSPRRASRTFNHEIFSPVLNRPGPKPGYSPPTHSRAGQVALLTGQGRVREAFEREQRRATRSGGPFYYMPDSP